MSEKTLTALIPAYEPTDLLPALAERLCDRGLRVVIVNDGSGDGYNEVFAAAGSCAEILNHELNKGKGQALRTGLEYIMNSSPDGSVIVTVDADGQHKVDDAVECLRLASQNPGALVLGCRSLSSDAPLRSRMGNGITRLVYRLASGKAVSDTQTGLRAFDDSLLPKLLAVSGDRYEYEMNMLLRLPKMGVRIIETPIETVYFDNNSGSHFRTVTDAYRVYKEIIKFAASSFLGFVVDYGLFSLLIAITAGITVSYRVALCNIIARVVSAAVNFTVNKKLVFKNNDSAVKTAAQYFILASLVLLFNTTLISFLTGEINMNPLVAKLITEVTFFTLSWLAQKFIIFRKRENISREVL